MSNALPSLAATSRAALVRDAASQLGLDACGIGPAAPIPRGEYLRAWLASGRSGTMRYLNRHVASREDVRVWLPWAKSVIVAALNYRQAEPAGTAPPAHHSPRGRVAMYAWGEDYHVVLKEKLAALAERLQASLEQPFQFKVCVDTSAILERELAAMAGVGWIGKNTLVLNTALGSCFVLGELFTDLDLPFDAPQADHCGSCTRCLDACPTGAFPVAYEMDASRCISYLTIEHRGEIDPELAADMGDWVFGCDVCQDVCPFNQGPLETSEPRLMGTLDSARPRLGDLARWNGPTHRRATAGRATARATPATWRRSARIALENIVRRAAP